MGSKSTRLKITSNPDDENNILKASGHLLDYSSSQFKSVSRAIQGPVPFEATGGTTYEPGNGYKYHKFTTATPAPESSLVVTAPGTIDLLVVAGGGGGGSYYGAGGGAGGVAHGVNLPVATGTYPVSVGPGAPANPGSPTNYFGNDGVNSYFGTPGSGVGGQPDYILAKGGVGGGKEPPMEEEMVVQAVVQVAATQVQ